MQEMWAHVYVWTQILGSHQILAQPRKKRGQAIQGGLIYYTTLDTRKDDLEEDKWNMCITF